ncbi:hypothetical protein PtA15_3A22 [Puccinia triticina]|uniref:Uncharacterized protein n=1 Tax=Puccinia triticina TaxID=208348 RepID=A0ABY7CD93_9BASI|nr:uncharacterized protein PtA15_3A22 [Puccinia triticina]WAQ82659.1 hypothetical protein PtA15_3A22 [Puccinia triticina]WAR53508.1 hypothetical protein PtB15_3B16 [Puccinia triticina]
MACCAPSTNAIAKINIPQNIQAKLKPGDQCYFSGRLIGLNNTGSTPVIQCNPEDFTRIPAANREFPASTDSNRIYVDGLGIVIKREELKTEPVMKNPPIMCTVKHNDWDEAKQQDIEFKVRYIIPPTTLLKSHALIQKGSEVSISGYLINNPGSREQWLVQTTAVSVLKNPPRCRKKEAKVPKKSIEPEKKSSAAIIAARNQISEPECHCNKGEGSSSGSTPNRRIIPSSDLIQGFSTLDIKGKGKEKC